MSIEILVTDMFKTVSYNVFTVYTSHWKSESIVRIPKLFSTNSQQLDLAVHAHFLFWPLG